MRPEQNEQKGKTDTRVSRPRPKPRPRPKTTRASLRPVYSQSIACESNTNRYALLSVTYLK